MAKDELSLEDMELIMEDMEDVELLAEDMLDNESVENADLENPIDTSAIKVEKVSTVDILGILILPLVVGTYLIVLGTIQLNKDCKVLSHTIMVIVSGGLVLVAAIFNWLRATECYSILPLCNPGRVKLTEPILIGITGLAAICLIIIPNVMALFLIIHPPGCTFTLNGFMIVYIGISFFNVVSLVVIYGLCQFFILCYNAE